MEKTVCSNVCNESLDSEIFKKHAKIGCALCRLLIHVKFKGAEALWDTLWGSKEVLSEQGRGEFFPAADRLLQAKKLLNYGVLYYTISHSSTSSIVVLLQFKETVLSPRAALCGGGWSNSKHSLTTHFEVFPECAPLIFHQ